MEEKISKIRIIFAKASVVLFFLVLFLGMILGFMLPLRPEVSEVEQRELKRFPQISTKTLIKGDFLSELSLWYADSYPGREKLIAVNESMKNLYGIKSGIMMVGNAVEADEIPDVESSTSALDGKEIVSAGDGRETTTAINGSEVVSELDGEPKESDVEPVVEPPKASVMEAEIKQHIQQSLYVKNGAAYSAYYFDKPTAERYINTMNHAAQRLEGQCDVYSILIPNQSGVMLPLDELKGLGGSDQIQAIHYFYSQYENVKTVDTIDTLRKHNDEYLYFRTDHHWTSLGAYYVYKNFCKEKGIESHELDYFEEMTFEPFLGSFYSQLQSSEMANNPDYVKAYVPRGTNDMRYWDGAGRVIEWKVIQDVSNWNKYSKYCCFSGGDKPLAIIENPEIQDGSACLVIKESYGNCFIPFLVDHYQTVHIMDYRYANRNAIEYIKENNIQDLIMINNITIIGGGSVTTKIQTLLN